MQRDATVRVAVAAHHLDVAAQAVAVHLMAAMRGRQADAGERACSWMPVAWHAAISQATLPGTHHVGCVRCRQMLARHLHLLQRHVDQLWEGRGNKQSEQRVEQLQLVLVEQLQLLQPSNSLSVQHHP